MCKFYKLTESCIDELLGRLTHVEAWVFVLLKAKNPFTDSFESIKTADLAKTLRVTRRTVQRAIKKLRELNLIQFKVSELEYKTNALDHDLPPRSSDLANDPQIPLTTLGSPPTTSGSSASPETLTNPSSHFPLDLKTNQTCLETDTQTQTINNTIFPEKIKEEEQNHQETAIAPIVTKTSDNNYNLSIRQNLPSSSIIVEDKRTVNIYSEGWLPDGVWKMGGKLDPAFQEWLAKKWVSKYGDCDLIEAKANVLAYFCNNPCKLPIRWQQYREEFLATAQNIQHRLNQGCPIPLQQQQQTLERISALKPIDEPPSNPVSIPQPPSKEIPVNPKAVHLISSFIEQLKSKKQLA